jgi:dehydro coenzyme F420 reductase / coenzyme F420-0:L-glutamate ligase / coenzyme F420-1:gamma-L-glutamate ligase
MTSIEVIPIPGIPEVESGADIAELIGMAIRNSGLTLHSGDVVAVTQKIVSKAEGRVVEEGSAGKDGWVARETRRVVARREDMVIAETRHGFVCANAGVDASNVAEGFLTLLPEDPDDSAERIREGLSSRAGVDVAVVVTDTFGRPWRQGLVNVAIGCAGLPSSVDLRGTKDATGRVLDATIVALGDEVAAAGGLVMGKAEGVPVAIVRGLKTHGPNLPASALVREPAEDLFRESPLQALHARRSIRQFGPGAVDDGAVREAVAAACTAPAPHHTRPWLFVAVRSGALRTRLLDSMAWAWRSDLRDDGTPEEVIARRLQKSDALLREAPALIVPFVRMAGAHDYADAERAAAEREMFLLSGGAAIENLMLALHAQGLASCWVSSTLFCKEETREALGLDEEWIPLGSVAAGHPPAAGPPPRSTFDPSDFLRELT